jgi:hypothetical protein
VEGGLCMTIVIQLYDKDMAQKDRIIYPMFSCRLSKEVRGQLKTAKLKSDKSWNKFIQELLIKNERHKGITKT